MSHERCGPEKQRLIDQFTGLATPVADEMRALQEMVAAQGEQIERLSDLLTAFIEASLPKQKKTQKPAEKPQSARTIRNAL